MLPRILDLPGQSPAWGRVSVTGFCPFTNLQLLTSHPHYLQGLRKLFCAGYRTFPGVFIEAYWDFRRHFLLLFQIKEH